jgi:molybdopterin converting factor small subunit
LNLPRTGPHLVNWIYEQDSHSYAFAPEAMNALVAKHPDVRRHLYTDEGKLRAFVNLYVNDEDIRYLQKEATAVSEGDNISIVPSIAGGAA